MPPGSVTVALESGPADEEVDGDTDHSFGTVRPTGGLDGPADMVVRNAKVHTGEHTTTEMDDSADREKQLSDTSRVEAFSDGVLAVAITLLVLDLRVPAHHRGGMLSGLLRIWPAYLGYLTSFSTSQ